MKLGFPIQRSSFEMQKILKCTSSIPQSDDAFTKILNIVVTKNSDSSEWEYPYYSFTFEPAQIIFEPAQIILESAEKKFSKSETFFLICQLVDTSGNALQLERFGIEGAMSFGNFFREFTPNIYANGQNIAIVRFDFKNQYAAGRLSFYLSNGQRTPPIEIYNIPSFNRATPQSQTLKINPQKFETGDINAYSPLEGTEFSENQGSASSFLNCVLVDDKDNILDPSEYCFSNVSFMTLSGATAMLNSVLGQSTLVVQFNFNGALEIGSIIFQITNVKKGNKFIVDPQVINVPTTGGGS